jgi:hypothetical protein
MHPTTTLESSRPETEASIFFRTSHPPIPIPMFIRHTKKKIKIPSLTQPPTQTLTPASASNLAEDPPH